MVEWTDETYGLASDLTELATKAFSAETANEQSFLVVAKYLLCPRCETTIDQFKLSSCVVCGVDVEADTGIVSSSTLSQRVKLAEDVRVLAHQGL